MTTKEPNLLVSSLISLVIHGLLALVLFFLAQHKPLPKVIQMQASLASGGDLASAKAQIAKAYAQNQVSTKTTQNTQTIRPTPTSELNQREKAYQDQMKAYAKALDEQMLSEFQAQREAYQQEDAQRRQEVAQAKAKERSNDDIAKDNAQSLAQANEKQAQDNKAKQAKADTDDDSPNAPTVSGASAGSSSGSSSSQGSGSATGTQGSGKDKSSAISAIQDRIHRNWSPQAGLKGKRLSATIKVDASGGLVGISFGSGDGSLQPSLEQAIRASAPFPEAVGVLSQFTANFYAD